MNNKEFITELSRRSNIRQSSVQSMALCLMDDMLQYIQENEVAQIPGFGTFEVKKRTERVLINPSGKKIMVPPKLVLGFKPVASFKERIQKGGEIDE